MTQIWLLSRISIVNLQIYHLFGQHTSLLQVGERPTDPILAALPLNFICAVTTVGGYVTDIQSFVIAVQRSH